ncbi:acetoacetyl-[acyl-carrier protein] synthase [Kushneria sinocarnis]|uniref:Acetoacetyl-[acyl-carrier protein] synthase n=2 Tax=Kushneria sinocarnis TaxID=595502 RepID=A0A420WTZ3_9GAMM|nr:acetoacetyl-[acyl-carrier protein] synthase [Kushneria sinocarnis]
MSQLPVIVGMGGVNAAGRTSGHQSFRRTVIDALPESSRHQTLLGLTSLMQLARRSPDWVNADGSATDAETLLARHQQHVLDHTLIRRLEDERYNEAGIPANRAARLELGEPATVTLRRRQLPERPPQHWQIRELDKRHAEVTLPAGELEVLLPDRREALVRCAGQLPSGFDPTSLYHSVHHPRGLSMAIFGASDCLGQSGFDWQSLADRVDPDEVAVYAGNSIGQLDNEGWGGLLQSYLSGSRVTSKQMPLGYGQMPADFLNAYVLGNVGATGAMQGACASFLYNLRLGVDDIRAGRRRVVLVGSSDAPITPEIIEGFRAMSALADDASLKALDALEVLTDADYQRACRPFARNCGFTIAESAQFLMLMDDSLALETGADILGAVPEVFVNADGNKRSISAPGIGNYITLAKSVALMRDMLGDEAVQQRSHVHAHGTSTPKNRTTESHVLDAVARANGIDAWPVVAIKAYLGHSQGAAGGDQLMSALGSFAHGLLPGIFTLDAVAEDVHAERLEFLREHRQHKSDISFVNAKGFGGNNATAPVISPEVTERLLRQRHGEAAMQRWRQAREAVRDRQAAYESRAQSGDFNPIYHFGKDVLEGPELRVHADRIEIPGYARPVSLKVSNPFGRLDS